jgi:AraC-like DNA-binding protein
VTETAFSVGFTDPSRFARAFRAKFGEAPARWASERRARVALAFTAAR